MLRTHRGARAAPPPAPIPVEPLSEARYRIQLNASRALKEKLDRLCALTRHTNPSGDLAVVIERALDLALEQVERQRFAKTDRPRPPRPRSFQTKLNRPKPKAEAGRADSIQTTIGPVRQRDHVPNAVLREVAERDQMQSSYRSASGCRCTARAFLQVHHERPWARGGDETSENLRLLCEAHNQ
ncbi:MAG TPA: HNH endonuclease, partial [Polyangiaceae bacterium]